MGGARPVSALAVSEAFPFGLTDDPAEEDWHLERALERTVACWDGDGDFVDAAPVALDNLLSVLADAESALLEEWDEEDRQSLEATARRLWRDARWQASYLEHLAEDETGKRRAGLLARAREASVALDQVGLAPEPPELSVDGAHGEALEHDRLTDAALAVCGVEEALADLQATREGAGEPAAGDLVEARRREECLQRLLAGCSDVPERWRELAVTLHAEARPTLRADSGDLAEVTDGCWEAIRVANEPDPSTFRFAGVASRLECDDEGAVVVRPLTPDRMRELLARTGCWRKSTKGRLARARPPVEVARNVLATPDPPLPVLRRVVEAPVFAPDGMLIDRPGFDRETGLFYAPPDDLSIPSVSERPSPAEGAEARRLIADELLGDFPFVTEADRAHAMALLLLPFARELIAGQTPLHVVDKPTPGSGATLLLDVVVRVATGRPVGAMAEGRDDEEWRKRVTAALLAGRSHLVIDNVRKRLDSGALAGAITAPSWEDRRLGVSEMVRVPARPVWACSGNNVALSDEMTRRSVRLRLDPGQDRPQLRTGFRHPDLPAWSRENRGALVWAALTMIRAWLAAGRPDGAGVTLGGFEAWSHVMGGVLKVAGIPGFLGNLDDFYAESEADDDWRGFTAAWHAEHAHSELPARELVTLASEFLDLGEGDHAGLTKRLGRRLREQRGRVFGELRLERARVVHRSGRWRVVRIGPGTSDAAPEGGA